MNIRDDEMKLYIDGNKEVNVKQSMDAAFDMEKLVVSEDLIRRTMERIQAEGQSQKEIGHTGQGSKQLSSDDIKNVIEVEETGHKDDKLVKVQRNSDSKDELAAVKISKESAKKRNINRIVKTFAGLAAACIVVFISIQVAGGSMKKSDEAAPAAAGAFTKSTATESETTSAADYSEVPDIVKYDTDLSDVKLKESKSAESPAEVFYSTQNSDDAGYNEASGTEDGYAGDEEAALEANRADGSDELAYLAEAAADTASYDEAGAKDSGTTEDYEPREAEKEQQASAEGAEDAAEEPYVPFAADESFAPAESDEPCAPTEVEEPSAPENAEEPAPENGRHELAAGNGGASGEIGSAGVTEAPTEQYVMDGAAAVGQDAADAPAEHDETVEHAAQSPEPSDGQDVAAEPTIGASFEKTDARANDVEIDGGAAEDPNVSAFMEGIVQKLENENLWLGKTVALTMSGEQGEKAGKICDLIDRTAKETVEGTANAGENTGNSSVLYSIVIAKDSNSAVHYRINEDGIIWESYYDDNLKQTSAVEYKAVDAKEFLEEMDAMI